MSIFRQKLANEAARQVRDNARIAGLPDYQTEQVVKKRQEQILPRRVEYTEYHGSGRFTKEALNRGFVVIKTPKCK